MRGIRPAYRRISRFVAESLLGLALAVGLASCARPPASAYYTARASAQGTPIGKNTTGEDCTLVDRGSGGADIFCGAWQQPSARIRSGGAASGANLMALATSSAWRAELEKLLHLCRSASGSVERRRPAMQSPFGGWPQIALVTMVGSTVWLADGTPAAFPVIQRGVAKLAGGGDTAAPAASTQLSADMASYLAARAFSAGDIAQYESLMTAGLQANLAGRPDEAEAYRAALALQEKQSGGKDTPASAAALMSVALQLSDEGHFEDAKTFFERAETALKADNAGQLDANGQARLALYRGLNAININDPDAALPQLSRAEVLYRGQVPDAREVPSSRLKRMLNGPVACRHDVGCSTLCDVDGKGSASGCP